MARQEDNQNGRLRLSRVLILHAAIRERSFLQQADQ